MKLIIILLIIRSCVAQSTAYTSLTTSTTTPNSSSGNETTAEIFDDPSSSFYDMTQIRHAIENAEQILKLLHKDQRPTRARPADVIQFYCANPSKKHFTQTYFDDTEFTAKLDTSKPIVFIVHGWMDTASSIWVQELSNVWIKYHNTNICRVDWSTYADTGYIAAAITKIRVAAEFIAKFIKNLNNNYDMPYSRMTIVGHSLGAHLTGFVGQRLKSQIGKIFGLDPAGPLFTVPIILPIDDRLDATDAKKVIIIHTCDGVLGVNIACGYQDFYPNKGKFPQSGCTWPSIQHTFEGRTDAVRCSHLRAVQYLIESLKPNHSCTGIKCNSIVNYLLKTCTYSAKLRVENIETPGRYYFKTRNANCTGSYY